LIIISAIFLWLLDSDTIYAAAMPPADTPELPAWRIPLYAFASSRLLFVALMLAA